MDNELTAEQREFMSAHSPIGWVVANKFVTENQKPVEYHDHRFMIDPMTDLSPEIVWRKSAQCGGSVAKIIKSFWCNERLGANVGYVLPTRKVVDDFVAPKVDPLIASNPALKRLITLDSLSKKQVGNRFTYFRGAFSEVEAIAISLDILILDELDRMYNMDIVNIYDSRLQASKLAYRWRLSNPSIPSFGISELFDRSDQKHWFVKCHHCGHNWFIDWEESDDLNHYVDQKREIYACGKCHKEISDDDRRNGEWIAAYPDSKISGYWISQLIVPYIPASRIIEQFKESSTDFFYNFVLGKPYQQADMLLERQVIIRNLTPQKANERNVAIGVDVGKTKHLVIGNPSGVFKAITVETWEDVEYWRNRYDAHMVIDAAPEFTIPQQLMRKYKGKVFLAMYHPDRQNAGIIRWGENNDYGSVHIDRTKAIDFVVQELTADKFKYYGRPEDYKEYIKHWTNIRRIVERNNQGRDVAKWVEESGKPDHFAHAHVYFRTALEKVFGGVGAGVVETMPPGKRGQPSPTVVNNSIELELRRKHEPIDDN